jgi:hypothetical protein
MGDHKQVLAQCRIALEGLATAVKKAGFEKDNIRQATKIKIPDWKKFFDDKEIGDMVNNIYRKLKGYVTFLLLLF